MGELGINDSDASISYSTTS